MNKEETREFLMNSTKEEKLCNRGYLVISESLDSLVPAYVSKWNKTSILGFSFYVHPKQNIYFQMSQDKIYFLIGHGYNSFKDCINEDEILNQLIEAEQKSKVDGVDYIDEITGIFVLGKIEKTKISLIVDCAGMMGAYYGIIKDSVVLTSHTVIASEIFQLEKSEYVKKLLKYKFYPLYGSFLPGDITPYEQLYRLIPNTKVELDFEKMTTSLERFYPNRPLQMVETEEEYAQQLEKIACVLKNSLKLTSQKWSKPAISLTGGMDSKTTLASANGVYDSFTYFSYISSKAEQIDAEAAHNICSALNLEHKIYEIPSPDNFQDFEVIKEVLQHSKDYIGKNNANDICKRAFFADTEDFDVEVKSWVSEIARANYYKKFEKKKMPKKVTPRRCSSLYKIFLHKRGLLYQTDKIFEQYIEKTKLEQHLFNFDWSDLFLWEVRYGAWGGLVITSEHKYSFDITIPYNNRKLLDLMLATPLEKRTKDILHEDLIKLMNSKIYETGISVVNLNETKFRAFCEKCYFNINTHLPF